VLAAEILARVSAEAVRPLPAAAILARVSGLSEVCTFPSARLRFQASLILALVSSLRFWPVRAADIFARVSGVALRPRCPFVDHARCAGDGPLASRVAVALATDRGLRFLPRRESPRR